MNPRHSNPPFSSVVRKVPSDNLFAGYDLIHKLSSSVLWKIKFMFANNSAKRLLRDLLRYFFELEKE